MTLLVPAREPTEIDQNGMFIVSRSQSRQNKVNSLPHLASTELSERRTSRHTRPATATPRPARDTTHWPSQIAAAAQRGSVLAARQTRGRVSPHWRNGRGTTPRSHRAVSPAALSDHRQKCAHSN